MKAYRYVARDPSPDGSSRFADVAVAGQSTRVELDQAMGALGYDFWGVVDGAVQSVAFPGGAGTDSASARVSFDDRPTPVAHVSSTGPPPAPNRAAAAPLTALSHLTERFARWRSTGLPVSERVRDVELAEPRELEDGTPPRWHRVLLPLILVLTCVVNLAVLRGDFEHEDFVHLYQGFALPFRAYLLAPFGGNFLAVHKLVYWLFERVFGLHALPYFGVALATHLVNCALLFTSVRRFTGKPVVAAVAAAVWATAPAHVGTLGRFGCYGQVFAATCLLTALVGVAGCARRRTPVSARNAVSWTVLLALAAASSPSGIAAALVFPLAVALLLPKESRPLRSALSLAVIPVAAVGICLYVHAATSGSVTDPSLSSLVEYAEARAAPSTLRLAAYGAATLLAGPLLTVVASRHAAFPLATIGAERALDWAFVPFAIFVVFVGVALFKTSAEHRRRSAGVVVMALAAYAVVPLTRAAPFIPLSWAASVQREHYAQTLALSLLLALSLDDLKWTFASQRSRATAVAFGCLVFVADVLLAPKMIDDFAAASRAAAERTDEALSAAVASARNDRDVFLSNSGFSPASAMSALGLAPHEFPGLGAYFVARHGRELRLGGRTIRFVESDPSVVAYIRQFDLPEIASLFVTSAEARRARGKITKVVPACLPEAAFRADVAGLSEPTLRARVEAALPACTDAPTRRGRKERRPSR